MIDLLKVNLSIEVLDDFFNALLEVYLSIIECLILRFEELPEESDHLACLIEFLKEVLLSVLIVNMIVLVLQLY
jgi:hypothetical protein